MQMTVKRRLSAEVIKRRICEWFTGRSASEGVKKR